MLVFTFSCKNLFDGDDNGSKDPREYTWTVDTLAYPGSSLTYMRSIWGSSPTDVYAVGTNLGLYGRMYHYDGLEWTDVKLHTDQGGNIAGSIDLPDIYGFGADDIWAVGYQFPPSKNTPDSSSFIIHYDGNGWREVNTPPGGRLFTIFGSRWKDVWAGGAYATLFHYDGSSWEDVSVPLPASYTPPNYFTEFRTIAGNAPDNIYAIITNWSYTSYLLSYDGNEWAIEDSIHTLDHEGDIWMSPSGKLYSAGWYMVTRWEGGSWSTLLEGRFELPGISGTDDDNIFVVGYKYGDVPGERHAAVLHYNGVDWYEYPDFEPYTALLLDVWTDGREVFITGRLDPKDQTLILHGR